MKIILTIGYEGAKIEDFIATLKRADVDVIIDIRAAPVSRKQGFSKRALAGLLECVGIDYVHLGDLGNPKSGREAARRGDMREFQSIFRTHLSSHAAQKSLCRALDIASSGKACLLCFERNYSDCHRAVVAEEMKNQRGVDIHHMLVEHGAGEDADAIDFGNRYESGFA